MTSRFPGTNPVDTIDEDGSVIVAGPEMLLPGGQARQYVAIPRFNIQASEGGGALAEHAQVVEYLAFDVDFLRTRLRRDPKHLVLIEARGDSMEPTIRDGDILTVDIGPDLAVQHSQVHVIRVADDLIVKRLERRLDGGLIVHRDNARYAQKPSPATSSTPYISSAASSSSPPHRGSNSRQTHAICQQLA